MSLAANVTTCSEIRTQLVAYQDGELAPSAIVLLEEHLDGCLECARLHERLLDATPEPSLVIPHSMHAALEAQLSRALDEAWNVPEPPYQPRSSWQRMASWLRRDTELPIGMIVSYAGVLLLAIAWGTANWLDAATLRAALEDARNPAPSELTPAGEIPADQYRPASYITPEESFH